MTTSDLARFLERIEYDPKKCWIWTGGRDHGYGVMSINNTSVRAHRVSHVALKGPIGRGLVVDHLCGVKGCVRPDHLEAVTQRENMARDRSRKNRPQRTSCRHGHPLAGANLYNAPDGSRRCRECNRAASRRYRDARRARDQATASVAVANA